ncbi:MAG: hypothetical protein K9N51_09915, partial [Candidatus Pacebacteria bacterium]|nr:hypothetical protein [Candidatus Paceibacterota bacterium]
ERYLDTIEQHPENSSIESGYGNFMVDAVVTLYSFGREQKAADYYDRLRERFSKSKYRAALNQFVLRELAGDISSATFDQGQATVQGFLFRMYYALALGDFERGEAFHRLAQQVWRKYMNQVKGSEDRRGLPPFDQMKRTMLNRCLNSFPEILANRLRRAVEEHVPMADAEVGAGTPP